MLILGFTGVVPNLFAADIEHSESILEFFAIIFSLPFPGKITEFYLPPANFFFLERESYQSELEETVEIQACKINDCEEKHVITLKKAAPFATQKRFNN